MEKTLDQKINEAGGDCIGVFTALLAARKVLGDEIVSQFIGKVEEKNSALWDRFKEYKKTVPESFGFHHFGLWLNLRCQYKLVNSPVSTRKPSVTRWRVFC